MSNQQAKLRQNFFIIPNVLFDVWGAETKIGAYPLLVYQCLVRHSINGCCFPSRKLIADKCCVSIDTVKRAIKKLIEFGLIQSKFRQNENGGQTSNLYVLPDLEVLTANLPSAVSTSPQCSQHLPPDANSTPKKTKIEQYQVNNTTNNNTANVHKNSTETPTKDDAELLFLSFTGYKMVEVTDYQKKCFREHLKGLKDPTQAQSIVDYVMEQKANGNIRQFVPYVKSLVLSANNGEFSPPEPAKPIKSAKAIQASNIAACTICDNNGVLRFQDSKGNISVSKHYCKHNVATAKYIESMVKRGWTFIESRDVFRA